ncbi:hypothetical protein IVB18_26285 [Bradyrhizobium sp. 186]|uniref:hypothetical protein n=1 Tax=Bradyrhizobium sp. 186 TaxID=2782654 RepID=UPI0020007F2A|nr:hypothetical protein [Bradyrhizobium sp. 186]UPK31839.1 hypothetical protein IVB18_26285 [Bradyrhizobium sp. 186]
MSAVKFVRVERDCPGNKNRRRDADANGTTTRLIIDYNVLVDGEHRATMMSEGSFGRGYRLHDADGRAICAPNRTWSTHLGETVEKKADFERVAAEYLANGRIPTIAAMAEQRKQEQEAARAERRERLDRTRAHIVKSHGIELYNALATYRDSPEVKILLADIDRDVADALANIDE